MTIELNMSIVEALNDTLRTATEELAKLREERNQLKKEVERNKLLTEKQAQEYLQRDHDSLRYYRTLGLQSFKIGKDRWYIKGHIDDWLESGRVNRRKV
ncbi:hypothetical protein [Spirosoma sp.]|uniref:hypothetical protein n=1 Tax=Spirosoma sp. TaxID=1899569 RepID=UPI003B3A4AEA